MFGLTPAVGGGFVGVAGGVMVTVLGSITKAFIGANVTVNELAGAGSLQSVNVTAAGRAKSLTIAGGVAGGYVGVAGGVDIGVLLQTVSASIGAGSTVYAEADVDVQALSIKNVQTYAVSIGGGFVGVAGSVSVWVVGTAATTSYDEAAASNDRGDFVAGQDYKTDDVVTDPVDGKRYAPREDICGTYDASKCPTPYTTAPHLDVYDKDVNTTGMWVATENNPLKGRPDTWKTGDSYSEGDIVVDPADGKNYAAREDIASSTDRPSTDVYDPTTNPSGKWKQAGDAVSDSDAAASGDGDGYKGVLGGTSAPDKGTWAPSTSYRKGDLVTFNGKQYVAAVNNPHPILDPENNPYDGPRTRPAGSSGTPRPATRW